MRKPKAITLTLEPWSDPKPGRLYPGRVKSVSDSGKCISIAIENRVEDMVGRVHHTELPKRLHPGNRTYRFAVAAGMDVGTLGARIDLRDSIGAIVNMRFIPVGDDYEIEFEKLKGSDQTEHGRGNPAKRGEETPASDTTHDG